MTQLFRAILFVSLLFTHAGMAQKQRTDGAPETTAPRPHLAWDRPEYRSFALQPYTNHPNHSIPYEDAPRAVYGPMGDYLTTGYDLYSWSETRQPGQEYNAGDRNSHLAPGHARVDWSTVFRKAADIGFSGQMCIETPPFAASPEYDLDAWKQMVDDCDRLVAAA